MKLNGRYIFQNADTLKWHVDDVSREFDTRAQSEWFALTGETVSTIDAERGLKTMARKLNLAKAIISPLNALAAIMDTGPDIVREFYDSGETFTDDDVAALGVTGAQIVAGITLLENLDKFLNGESPTIAQYRVNVNALRRALEDQT